MRITEKRILFPTLAVLALAVQVPPVLPLLQAWSDEAVSPVLVDRDFVNYWMGSSLTLSGQELDLFRIDDYGARLVSTFGPQEQDRNWSYPPHYLLLLLPLGLLPYEAASVAFLIVTFALFAGGALALRRSDAPEADALLLWSAVAGYALVNVNSVQNGFLVGSFLLLGLAFRGRQPVLAGLAFALLTVKPQLGLLVPLLLLVERDWRTILWSGVFTVALVALSASLFGIGIWRAYVVEALADQQEVLTEWTGIFVYMMPTAFGAARSLGIDPAIVSVLQWPVSIAAAVAALWLFARDESRIGRSFALLCATFLVSPYGFDYDMGALTVAAALLAAVGRGTWTDAVMMVVAFLPAFVLLTGLLGAPVAPLILSVGLLARLWAVAVQRRRVLA